MNNEDNAPITEAEAEEEFISPLQALAISLAYEIMADGKVSSQQRAQLIALFGKLVETEAINEGELHGLVSSAFKYVSGNNIEKFLKKVTPALTETQKLAIIINLYETMQVDGQINAGERTVVQFFEDKFGIDAQTTAVIKKFLSLKNDTSIFLDLSHPLNNTTIDIKSLFV